MGRIESNPGIQAPNSGQPVGSYPQNVQSPLPHIGNPWNSGLFDCHLDPTNAVMTTLFPCVTFGQVAEVLDATDPLSQLNCTFGSLVYLLLMGVCANCVIGSKYRKKLRSRYGLVEAPYEDELSHLLCPFCSLCQEFRELKSRGLDPALGWQGIIAREQAMQQMNKPPPPQAMSM
ncbi:hypothetical protein BUALT_Bualt07G0145100 [Buddleja alternifolia]|uniref:Uncharacterized protein n=1 Tax=Buddleja alternifolia TaxID=168488 RepID=A0AAV6XHT1_9LAMI|nr:hypothetical protein BUALT_Bualt07G0145100 [Buddleja alternifolia]